MSSNYIKVTVCPGLNLRLSISFVDRMRVEADAYGNTFESPAVYCENCNAALSEAEFRDRVWNFCPVCGFKMKDETEEQHETD